MAPRKLHITALLILLISLVACGSPTKLSLTNPRMATDRTGMKVTTVYSPSDEFFAVADLNNAPKGTVVSAKWYAVDVPGYKLGDLLDETTLTVDDEMYTGYVSFEYTYKGGAGWPLGEYKTEFYLNGDLKDTLTFHVR